MELVYQGEYKIEAVRPDGTCRTLECIPNLITDVGLDRILDRPTNTTAYHARVGLVLGQGNTTPSVSDESLASQVGDMITVNSRSGTNSYVENDVGVVEVSWTGTGTVGNHAGNISELGVYVQGSGGTTVSNNNRVLFSRALVRTESGSPTTITILSDEYARLTYTLRIYFPGGFNDQVMNDGSTVQVFNGNIGQYADTPLNPLYYHLDSSSGSTRFKVEENAPNLSLLANWPSRGSRNISVTSTKVTPYALGSFSQDISHNGIVTAVNGTYDHIFGRVLTFGIKPEDPISITQSNTPFDLTYRVELKRSGARMNTNYLGEYRIVKYQGDNIVEDTDWFPNIIVNQGLDYMGNSGNTGWDISKLCIGKGTAAASPLDTYDTFADVVDQAATASGTPTRQTVPQRTVVQEFEATFPAGSLNGTYYEIGSRVTDSVLLSRALIADVNGTPSSIFVDPSESLKIFYRAGVVVSQARRGVINGVGLTYRPLDIGSSNEMFHPMGCPGRIGGKLFVSDQPAPAGYGPVTGGTEVSLQSIVYGTYVPGSFRHIPRVTTVEATADKVWRSFWFTNETSGPHQTWIFSLDTPVTQATGERMILDFDLNWGRYDGTS